MSETTGIAAAIKEIVYLVKSSTEATLLAHPGPAGRFFLCKPNGEIDSVQAWPGWRQELVATADALAHLASTRVLSGSTGAELWLSEYRATLVYDRADRRDRADLPFRMSTPFAWLKENGGKNLSQSDLVRALRVDFHGCLTNAPTLLASIRRVKFQSESSSDRSISHGAESIGTSVLARAAGVTEEIPEEIQVTCPVFENAKLDRLASIGCAFEVDVAERCFRITPYPGELASAVDAALNSIACRFSIDVFMGQCPMPGDPRASADTERGASNVHLIPKG